MKPVWAIAAFVLLAACDDAPPVLACRPIAFTTDYEALAPTAQPSGKQLFLFGDLGGDISTWKQGRMRDFVDRLRADGHAVVLMPYPASPVRCYWLDGGEQYREGFRAMLTTVKAQTGAAQKLILGISYGGLHALMGADLFDGWIAMQPVTRLDALAEFRGVGDVPSFNPFHHPALQETPGLLQWGTRDGRVNGQLTADLASQLGARVTKVRYDSDHTTTPAMLDDVRAWVVKQSRP